MGSGVKSVPFLKLLDSIRNIFDAVVPAKVQIATKTVPLSAIEENWDAPGKPRIVFTIRWIVRAVGLAILQVAQRIHPKAAEAPSSFCTCEA